jgi:hypothetical protein
MKNLRIPDANKIAKMEVSKGGDVKFTPSKFGKKIWHIPY